MATEGHPYSVPRELARPRVATGRHDHKTEAVMRTKLALILLVSSLTLPAVAKTKSKFFKTSDGIRIHYLEAGKGHPIVFIPGWTMPAWIWQKQIDQFSKKYRVIAIDPRSQGESDKALNGNLPEIRARDYKELVDHLALRHPVLVGWSMGSAELILYAEQFGTDNIASIVLVDENILEKPKAKTKVSSSGGSGSENQFQNNRQKQTDDFVRGMFRKPQPEDYLKRLVQASLKVPDAVVLAAQKNVVPDYSGGLARMNRPVLFAYVPERQSSADFLKSKLGDKLRLVEFPGAGHALFVDEPEKFNRVLEEFLQEPNTLPPNSAGLNYAGVCRTQFFKLAGRCYHVTG